MSLFYNKKGERLESLEWAKIFEDRDYKKINYTELPNGFRVSTVWIGVDHNYGDGDPLIFETMVFPPDEGTMKSWRDLDCERYSTEEEALAGHEAMCAKWLAKERSPIAES